MKCKHQREMKKKGEKKSPKKILKNEKELKHD